jgi:hypothetical protein
LEYKNPVFTKSLANVVVEENSNESDSSITFDSLRNVNQVTSDIDLYREYFDKPVDKTLRLDMTLNGKTKDDLSLKMQHTDD